MQTVSSLILVVTSDEPEAVESYFRSVSRHLCLGHQEETKFLHVEILADDMTVP